MLENRYEIVIELVFDFSQTVLNRCVPEQPNQQPDSRVSKTGLRDFFQVKILFFFGIFRALDIIVFLQLFSSSTLIFNEFF